MTQTTDVDRFYDRLAEGQFTDTMAGDVRNPYPALAEKRRTTPVECGRPFAWDDPSADFYTVYRFDDVNAVLRDNVTYSSAAIREQMAPVMGPHVLVGLDEPEHKRHRSLVAQAFRSKNLAHWEGDFVEGVVNGLIDRFAQRGRAELVREFTFRFPVQVVARVLGVPADDFATFHEYAIDIINVAADPERGIRSSAAMRDYFATIVDQRRRDPGDDVISDLVGAELDGERLDDEEIFSFLRLLLPAGAETTYRSTGSFIFALLSNPDQMEALRADRSLMPQATEESARWETPLLITSRRSTRDTEIGGVEVPAGSTVIPHIGSANHDQTRWEDAERFDIFREPKPLASFGAGPHMCLGMHLARMEMASAVGALLDRFPDLRLDPDADDVHIHGDLFRSPTSLPVLF